LSAEVEEAA